MGSFQRRSKVAKAKLEAGSELLPEGMAVAVHSGLLFVAQFDWIPDPGGADF